MSRKRRIAVDFDGTLARFEGWKGHRDLGEPIPRMVERVKAWLAEGHDVFILTARITPWKHSDVPAVGQVDVEEARRLVEDWSEKHIGKRLEVTNIKGGFDEFWDDHVCQIIPNTGVTLQEYVLGELLNAEKNEVDYHTRRVLARLACKVASL